MRLSGIGLKNFRNISDAEIVPHKGLNIFVGENAQGKTSLIEAVYLLSTLRSFRTGRLNDLIQNAAPEEGRIAVCHGTVAADNKFSDYTLKVRVGPHDRKIMVNEKSTTSSKFIGNLRTVLFSPESLSAIKGGPDQRRDLIDQAAFQILPNTSKIQRDFTHSLRQRNALLKQIRDQQISVVNGRQMLEGIDQYYLGAATGLIFNRLLFLSELKPFFDEALGQITGNQNNIEVRYQSAETPWIQGEEHEIKSRLRDELFNSTRRVAEESLGTTLTGPHRHDISILFNGNDSRFFCSQGQQRALILAFKIAEIMYHRRAFDSYPLLLLDDVLSEFDEKRRNFLIDFLRRNEAQTFLTTTDQTQALPGSSLFKVKEGKIGAPQ